HKMVTAGQGRDVDVDLVGALETMSPRRSQRQKCVERSAGTSLGAPLEPAAHENEGDDHAGGLEIEMMRATDEQPDRPTPGGERASAAAARKPLRSRGGGAISLRSCAS